MPTKRPRHTITESDRLKNALRLASELHPELADNKTDLVREILNLGIESLERKDAETKVSRQQALKIIAGTLPNIWPADNKKERLAESPS